MNNYLIYKHTSPSGKAYIGQTNNLKRRNKLHKYSTGCTVFSSAIKKYGFDNFKHEILASNLTIEEANKLECEFISEHNTIYPNGYNLMSGGMNSTHSEKTKQTIRIS